MANIIDAIVTLVQNPVTDISRYEKEKSAGSSKNKAGYPLEAYIKDLFADALELSGQERESKLATVFSYQGDPKNPPDAMLRGGDAIEVKKVENVTPSSKLQLNSSYPEHVLRADDEFSKISQKCKAAEDWEQKDMLYVVGVVPGDCLKDLCMVYGADYCASNSCYCRPMEAIQRGLKDIGELELADSAELGRVNSVDPSKTANLRVRGMWEITNPWSVFKDVYTRPEDKDFSFMCIVNDSKWRTLENRSKLLSLQETIPALTIEDVKVRDPDDTARQNPAKLISFYK